MSYIIKNANPFASTKLTEKGREKLAKGQLTFSSWAIGDSEINYDREQQFDDEIISGDAKVLRPKDRQPDLKYFINTGGASPLVIFGENDIRCIKAIINNEADERGHFTGNLDDGFVTKTRTSHTEISGYTSNQSTISNSEFHGTDTVDGFIGTQIGDFILLKIGYTGFTQTNEEPQPHLWFKVHNVVGGVTTLDRPTPRLDGAVGTVAYIIYKSDDLYDIEPDAVSYWDSGTLSFDSSCDVTINPAPFWNMNHIYSDNILGITGTTTPSSGYEKYENFGSYDLVGQKNDYLFDPLIDNDNKSVGVIHYTNKAISNLYGEFLFVDNDSKTVKLHLPDLMYHRRKSPTGSTSGIKMGMTFVGSGTTKSVGTNGLIYVDLIELAATEGGEALIDGTPLVVGRVYTDLKIIVITDDEILAAMSYKSNRNWTLPKLDLGLVNPFGGIGTGTLGANKTMHVTYSLDNVNAVKGLKPTLPCQNYSKIINENTTSKDVQFNIEDAGLLPYMRFNDSTGGFYGNTFKVMYQINDGEAPKTDEWKVIDYSSSVLTGDYIDVEGKLEVQNPLTPNPTFEIDATRVANPISYSIIDTLNMADSQSPDNLQFGDERFFYGNVEASIGATIYKTLFKININASDFNKTTNLTRSVDPSTNPPVIKVSEVGIYDTSGDLVIISKLSKPIKLTPGNTVMIELSMDF